MSAPSNYYIQPDVLYALLSTYVTDAQAADAQGIERPPIPDALGDAVWQIAHGLARRHHFARYTLHEDMVSHGITHTLSVLAKFDPERSRSAFSWVTSTLYYSFLRFIGNEDAQLYRRLQLARYLDDNEGWDCRQYLDDHADQIAYHTERSEQRRERAKQRRGKSRG